MDVPSKSELRSRQNAARRARGDEAIARDRAAIRGAVLARCDRLRPSCVAAYVPLPTEPGSVELLAALTALGIRVLVPVLLANKDLDWTLWTADEADPENLGVDAIAQAQLVVVPALAVAQDGTRLGRGGGSYDRALGRVGDESPVIALLFEDELVDALPRDSWDRPVRAVVLPGGWREVGDR
ncbi:MAG: 5-formyltetrahydrofolate cyclo-ligase [Jatrophihabitantaceae bacterium]